MHGVSFGIKTSQSGISYADILRVWREADTVDVFADAWLWDHMVPLRGPVDGAALEGWTLLAALAAQTSRLRLGVIVTSNRLRPPAVLAKMAATVDVISGGRLNFGIGAGGSAVSDPNGLAMVRREFDAYGIDIVSPRIAVDALAEACVLAKRMWTETQPFDFTGEHYRLTGAVCAPKPVQQPHPPIMIGSGGERFGLRVVAEHADVWNCPILGGNTAELRTKSAILDEHCAAIGRDPDEITRSVQLIVRGTDPAPTRDAVLELIDAGARHLVLAPVAPLPSVRRLADEIVEPVLAQLG
ncbi:MAG TPA: LLM class flavin-dependent oxidoreductase [Pseudonocardiaceae bacterium]|jgi:alkanesulfonate monooxygenase SsuD/methylene tetrahydromethanopterin reductase-like flavin-dependent oxidoreductase (luciferase family)